MKKVRTLLLAITALLSYEANAQYTAEENFDKGWRFIKDEADGAQQPNFDDSTWESVNLPHDWAIYGEFEMGLNSRTGGLPIQGTGWYRKSFAMDAEAKDKVVRIEFEGAMCNSEVWINGTKAGERPFGYIGFEFDISELLKYDGSENIVAVRLQPEELAHRWYSGAGLYRSVWLKIDEPIYVDTWGTYIITPTATPAIGVVQNETTVVNKSDKSAEAKVSHEYFDADGASVATGEEIINIAAGESGVSGLYSNIESPKLWDLGTPHLYTCITTIEVDGRATDSYTSHFGVRTVRYDKDHFYLNNKPVRFNGVCLHHDNGALGAEVYRRADERKLQIMKEMGVNAIRTSHNPPSRELLELCDQMGLMVLDEAFDCWALPKVTNGYHNDFREWSQCDIEAMVTRDRNHPSIVMWSLGNEIKEQWIENLGWREAKRLNSFVKALDLSRPTTIGFNSFPTAYIHNMAQQVDIVGMNYKPSSYAYMRETYPELAIYGSETSSCVSSRGVYHLPLVDYDKHPSLQVTSYDYVGLPWAYAPDIEFHFQKENPNIMGEFIWTGFDYLGEPSPYGGKDNMTHGEWNEDWPSRSSYFGACDLAGFPKDRYYLYQSQWTTEPMIHLLPHWNWEGMEGETIPVYCYTNCDEAELFVNGVSQGRKIKGRDKTTIPIDFLRYDPKSFDSPYRLSWNDVKYEKGEIKVIGYKGGKAIVEQQIKTAGAPAKVILEADRTTINADGRDLSYVTVKIVDKDGNFCPTADNMVDFAISGVGDIVGVDNGDATSLSSFKAPYREAFNGLALAIIRSSEESGTITLKATSKGLKTETITIQTK